MQGLAICVLPLQNEVKVLDMLILPQALILVIS